MLGVRPVINAAATTTRLGGSLLAPPVLAAMADAATRFVDIDELQLRVGERIADITGNEAAYICSGAWAGVTLSVAGCMAGADPRMLEAFPTLEGVPRREVVLFRGQRRGYDYNARQLGARIVEVDGEPESLRRALGSATACVLWFAGTHFAEGALPVEQVVPIAHAAGVPVLVDAAAQIPPIASLWHFTAELNADAAIFSGGKGLRGPQPTGLVLGRSEIIEGCRAHGSPNHAVGRGMKVGKEELFGLLAAVEWSLEQDEAALLAHYESIVDKWLCGLDGLPTIQVERGYPSEAGQPHGRAVIRLAPDSGWTRDRLVTALWDQDPRIAVGTIGGDAIALNPQTLEPGEDAIVLEALRRLLASGRA